MSEMAFLLLCLFVVLVAAVWTFLKWH